MRNTLAVLGVLAIAGCNPVARDDRTLGSANGETPVRYVICSVGDTNCFVAARFKDFGGCQSHDRWASMLCDSASTPGRMVCEQDKARQIAVTHCTL